MFDIMPCGRVLGTPVGRPTLNWRAHNGAPYRLDGTRQAGTVAIGGAIGFAILPSQHVPTS
jgi:hypothetical protein